MLELFEMILSQYAQQILPNSTGSLNGSQLAITVENVSNKNKNIKFLLIRSFTTMESMYVG